MKNTKKIRRSRVRRSKLHKLALPIAIGAVLATGFPAQVLATDVQYLIAQAQPDGENQGVTDATTILNTATQAGDLVAKGFDRDWQTLVSGDNPVYLAIVAVSALVATTAIAWWSLGWYTIYCSEGFSIELMSQTVVPFLVMLLLFNNGALLATSSFLLRSTGEYLNSRLLSITKDGISFREAIRGANVNQALAQALSEQLKNCQSLPTVNIDEEGNETSPQQECIEKESKKAKEEVDKYREENNIPANAVSLLDPGALVGQAINSAVQGLLFVVLGSLSGLWQILMQQAYLLTAYTGPIFFTLSLFFGFEYVRVWLSGWVFCILWQVCYSAILGDTAAKIAIAPQSDPLIMPLVQGLAAPILAGVMAGGAGYGVFLAGNRVGRAIVGSFL